MPGRPEHDPVAVGRPHAGVRGPVVLADVRLDLDDPPTRPRGRSRRRVRVADEPGADQRAGGREGVAGEELPRERGAAGPTVRVRPGSATTPP